MDDAERALKWQPRVHSGRLVAKIHGQLQYAHYTHRASLSQDTGILVLSSYSDALLQHPGEWNTNTLSINPVRLATCTLAI